MMRVLLALVLAACVTAAPDPVAITAMTYNIGSAAEIPLTRHELRAVAYTIKKAGADIVGLTEVDIGTDRHLGRDMVGELAVELADLGYPMHRYYTPIQWYHGGWRVIAIFSRFPIVAEGYAITHEQGFPFREEWKVASVSVEAAPGIIVHAFMTHYWIGDGSRHPSQTETILRYAAGFEGPKVLMGDFNLTPSHPCYRMILDAGWVDTAVAATGGHIPTVSGIAGVVAPERLHQIDYVFVSPDLEVLDAYVPDMTVSDHWPLVARLRLPYPR